MLKILPYKLYSKSAKDLAQALRVKRIRPSGSYRPSARTTVVNWGSSRAFAHSNMLNKPQAIAMATNKLYALQKMKEAGVSVPDFTTDKAVAQEWQEDGFRVVCRTILTGHSGQGIVIAQPDEPITSAPLYTKYTKKDKEYRVHVFKGKILDVCEKRKRSGMEGANSLVRTLNNGWVYCRQSVVLPDVAKTLSLNAVKALGLDFGAVDIIARGDKFYCLEVNSAPGIQGTTLQKYVEALREYI
jgi:glutathione synthase/RimK-type ligase-like ATP-grasp enzyme